MSEEKLEAVETVHDQAPRPNRKPFIIALTVFAVVIGGLLIYLLLRDGSGAGQPVSAPRTVSFNDGAEQPATTSQEQMLTIPSEQVERIGLKIEPVGETISSQADSVAATGVVQANAYKETPVISLLGGVLRSVSGELGQNVAKGQTVAVIFSDEFASSQSKYLALRTEAQTARQNYDRTVRLVKISPVSNTEVDRSLAALNIAQAEVEEHHSHHMRAENLLAIGAISREEFEMATTKRATAEANLVEAKKRYDRAVSVAEIDPVARGDFEMAAVKRQTAESDLAAAGQRLMLFGLSPARLQALRLPSQITSDIALIAPVSGTITKRDANAGEVVEANKELMRVTDLASVWVVAQVYENELARLHDGSGASVTSDAFPGRLFRGHVTYIDSNISPDTRTAQVRIELDNPGRVLKLGMYVNASFGAGGMSERTVPMIPTSAVQNISDRKVVFVATDKPNVFAVRTVRLGAETKGRAAVLEGLQIGDRVVTEGSFLLRAEMIKQGPAH
ncbi:MAG: efflux RND transporter periplasmic adaptor subunit [Acidobacteriota bacterium]